MKELISISKKSRSSSVNGPSVSRVNGTPSKQRGYAPDVKFLQDSISSLKSELLTLKQLYAANEETRSEEVKSLKANNESLKHDLRDLRCYVSERLNEVKGIVERIECDRTNGIVSLKNSIKVLSETVHCLEDNIDTSVLNLSNRIEEVTKQQSKSGKKPAKANGLPKPIRKESCKSTFATSTDTETCTSQSPQSSNQLSYSMVVKQTLSKEKEGTCTTQRHPSPCDSGGNSNTATHSNQDTCAPGEKIQVIGSGHHNRHEENVTTDIATCASENDEDFGQFIRKKNRIFYVGGFKASVQEEKISNYITNRGVKIVRLQVIRNYNYDTACLKLSVVNNDDSEWLENPFFWPHGILCRTWVSRQRYRGNTKRENPPHRYRHTEQVNQGRLYNRSDIDEFNPYIYLDSDYES
jgi:hypothetical protein